MDGMVSGRPPRLVFGVQLELFKSDVEDGSGMNLKQSPDTLQMFFPENNGFETILNDMNPVTGMNQAA